MCTVHALMAALALKLKVARVQHGGEGGVGDEDVKVCWVWEGGGLDICGVVDANTCMY